MNRSQGNLQDAFLNSARRENVGVTIYLVSGVQLRGVIRAFDAFTVLLESQGRPPQMVYKHAIASVAPVRAVTLDVSGREEQAEPVPAAAAPSGEAAAPSGGEADLPERAPREVPVAP